MSSEIYAVLGLKANPFPSGACKDFYFQTESTRRFLDELLYGITSRKGFLVLVGEVGLGKTSLLLQLFPMLEQQESIRTSWVFNTLLDKTELLRAIARDFGIDVRHATHLAELLDALHQFFLAANRDGHNCAIIIDEAHLLDFNCMEVLRMLSNLELSGEKLVQIVLAGQPELKERLEKPELRQFRSRINNFLELPPFSMEDTHNYVNFKFSTAGSELRLDGRALTLVWNASGGNTRQINLIMEKTLYAMVAMNEKRVSFKTVSAALRELSGWNRELEGKLRFFKWRRYAFAIALGAGGLLLALVATLLVLSQRNAPSPEEAALEAPAMPAVVESASAPGTASPQIPAATAPTASVPVAVPPPAAASAPAQAVLPDNSAFGRAARSFLEPWQLASLEPALREAVAVTNPAALQQRIATVSPGLQLLPLEKLPDRPAVTCSSFPWGAVAGGSPAYVLLWKPPLRIPTFTDGHQGPEITALQERLATLRYYQGVDGKVGPGTRLAVLAFQKEKGLKQTGEPDAVTLFWLFAENGESRGANAARTAGAGETKAPSAAPPPTGPTKSSGQPPDSVPPPGQTGAQKPQFGL